MKSNYELKGPPRQNPYAEKIKKHGYSVSIHYDTIEDEEDFRINTVMKLLNEPGLSDTRNSHKFPPALLPRKDMLSMGGNL